MTSDRSTVTSAELIEAGSLSIGDGYRARNDEMGLDGLPFVRAGNIDGGFRLDDADILGAEGVRRAGDKIARAGDSLFTSKGTVGRFAYVKAATPPFVYSPQLCYWRVLDRRVLEPRFVSYWLQGPESWSQIVALKGQTDMADYISLTDQRQMRITLPSVAEQSRIAGVLGALDDKVECCRRIVGRLEQLLWASFDKQFVQSPDLNGATVSLASIARFVNGRAFTKDANGRARPILRIRELNSGIDDSTRRSDIEAHEDNIARHSDLLFSWSGSLDVYRWSGPESLINQHIFKVVPDGAYPAWFVEGWIRHHLPEFQAIASGKATTMGHIQRHHLDEAKLVVPHPDELRAARTLLDPLDELRSRLALEMRDLIGVRDALLPKLVSGEIRVPESYEPPAEAAA